MADPPVLSAEGVPVMADLLQVWREVRARYAGAGGSSDVRRALFRGLYQFTRSGALYAARIEAPTGMDPGLGYLTIRMLSPCLSHSRAPDPPSAFHRAWVLALHDLEYDSNFRRTLQGGHTCWLGDVQARLASPPHLDSLMIRGAEGQGQPWYQPTREYWYWWPV